MEDPASEVAYSGIEGWLLVEDSVYASSSSESEESERTLFSWRSDSWKLLLVRFDALDVRVCLLETLAAQSVSDDERGLLAMIGWGG